MNSSHNNKRLDCNNRERLAPNKVMVANAMTVELLMCGVFANSDASIHYIGSIMNSW